MPLNVRSIAVSIAVICFFGISVAGSVSGFSTSTCCKRALLGAAAAYLAAALAVRAVNTILVEAMISKQLDRQKERTGDNDS